MDNLIHLKDKKKSLVNTNRRFTHLGTQDARNIEILSIPGTMRGSCYHWWDLNGLTEDRHGHTRSMDALDRRTAAEKWTTKIRGNGDRRTRGEDTWTGSIWRSLSMRLKDLCAEDVDSLALAFSPPSARGRRRGGRDPRHPSSLSSTQWRVSELSPIDLVFFLRPKVTIFFPTVFGPKQG
jgi:hypothetical protein